MKISEERTALVEVHPNLFEKKVEQPELSLGGREMASGQPGVPKSMATKAKMRESAKKNQGSPLARQIVKAILWEIPQIRSTDLRLGWVRQLVEKVDQMLKAPRANVETGPVAFKDV